MVRPRYSVMTYVYFELLLICVNKYSMREIRYRERESLETYLEAKRKILYYRAVGLYL